MKSPETLSRQFARQWEYADIRESRLLGDEGAWPISLPVGKPAPRVIASDLDAVKQHIERWRKVRFGKVIWESIAYRATAEPVAIPVRWECHTPSDWIQACSDPVVRREFEVLSTILEETSSCFHSLLICHRSLTRGMDISEVIQATQLAMVLQPECAEGRPLRALSLAGIDTKFFERNERLIKALLDVRFDGEAGKTGLETFLGAANEKTHWLLVVDLDGELLPFRRQRVASDELKAANFKAKHILIVENESSLHQLPPIKDTIAILGAGFDLTWTDADWLRQCQVAYWGDIDTWGLQCLAKARSHLPHLTSLMMNEKVFEANITKAVPEVVKAAAEPPHNLTPAEQTLYSRLLHDPKGRLEQEFLQISLVHEAIANWFQKE